MDYDKDAMDKAGETAEEELREMKWEDVKPIAVWRKNHFMKAGHKRLGRALIQLAKEKGVK